MKKFILSILMILIVVSIQACNGDSANGQSDIEFLDIHQTGQTTSNTPGDDGDFQSGVIPPVPRFRDNGNGTITDNLTGFLWTKDAGCVEDNNWENTLTGASTIGNGDCGLTDGSNPGSWKVANIRELHTLLDYGNNSPTLPDNHPFTGIELTTDLWSSTSVDSDSTLAFILDLENGEVLMNSKTSTAGCMILCCSETGNAAACGGSC